MKTTPPCRVCGNELDDDNWSPPCRKNKNHICKECDREYHRLYWEANRDKLNASHRLHREENKDDANAYLRLYRKNNPEKTKADRARERRKRGMLPMNENTKCPAYLGVHINERLLRHKFNDVEVMPYGNPGYDIVCNHGKKIDGKASCFTKDGRWIFTINHNTTADYFICVAYDNLRDLNPLHIWMLPGNKFNHLKCTSIRPSTIDKWAEYEQDLSGIIACCDEIKSDCDE